MSFSSLFPCPRTIQGKGSADDKLGSAAGRKNSIQDANEDTSQLASSVQSTEIYIPVPDWQCPRVNILVSSYGYRKKLKGGAKDILSYHCIYLNFKKSSYMIS